MPDFALRPRLDGDHEFKTRGVARSGIGDGPGSGGLRILQDAQNGIRDLLRGKNDGGGFCAGGQRKLRCGRGLQSAVTE